MKSSQVKGKETEELKQLYKNLEQDWNAFKRSNSTTASSKYTRAPSRDLMPKPQQESSPPAEAWKSVMMMRAKDLVAQEMIRERMEATERGQLKGRPLFLPMQGESTEPGFRGWIADDIEPHPEVRSLSFYHFEDHNEHEENDESSSGSKGLPDCTLGCSYSSSLSSSSLCVAGASVDMDQEVKGAADIVKKVRVDIGRLGNGGRHAVFVGGLAIALLIIAISMMSSARSSGGYCDVILVPT